MPHHNLKVPGDRPFLDIVSHGRGTHDQQQLLSTQVEQITRTVRYTPEVMVKISGGGQSAKAVAAHFNYIGRREFDIETDDGQRVKGKDAVNALIEDWELDLDAAESRSPYRGASGRKPAKLVHNIVLSMPAGTPAQGVLDASRAFAREQFALKHRYAFVLHTDQPHPHVHLVVKAMNEQGRRMNIRKETLREWRRQFASQLRAIGIAANATERVVRGVTKPQKRDGIHRAMRDGRSTHMRSRVDSVRDSLRAGCNPTEPAKVQIVENRRVVVRGWLSIREALHADGREGLASEVDRFLTRMPPPMTEREWIAQSLWSRARELHLEMKRPPELFPTR
jgi:hypothetical protein